MQTTIQGNRQREYERQQAFELFEYQRRLTDEVTDMSERLAAPMRNRFEYNLGEDGELWFQGEPIKHVFDDGIAVAEELAQKNPQFVTELVRRHLERQEYDAMCELARGREGSPDILVIESPIPDAVLKGVHLNAYDRKRKKTLVRVFCRTANGIEATSLSLDRSDRDGLNAIAELFGGTIDADATSEDILAMRFWGYADDYKDGDVVKSVCSAYDKALSKKLGGEWYAGRQPSEVLDAKAFIETQPDLVRQHMEVIMALKKSYDGDERDTRLEDARYNLAAALTRRMRGDSDAGSLPEAGAEARAKGETYQGDCPTGVASTVQQSLSELGLGKDEHMRCVTCPICGTKGVDGIVSGRTITCSKKGCQVDRRTGKVLRGPGGASKTVQEKAPSKGRQLDVKAAFGNHVEERVVSSIGNAERVVYDRSQDKAVARITDKGFAALV